MEKLMRTLGIEISDYHGREGRKKDWRKVMGFNTEDEVDLEELLRTHDGWSEESQHEMSRLEEAGELEAEPKLSLPKPSNRKVRLREAWSAEGEPDVEETSQMEFTPTRLEGALEIDPSSYADSLPRSDIPRPSPSNPFHTPSLWTDPTAPEDLPPSIARDNFSGETAWDDTSDYAIASESKVNLSGLGPGWMEDHAGLMTTGAKKVAAKDRLATFKALGISVPNLVSFFFRGCARLKMAVLINASS